MRRCLIIAVVIVSAALPLLATEPNPSVRQRELIEKLLDATDSGNTANSVMDAMFAQIEQQFIEQAGNDAEDIEEAKERFSRSARGPRKSISPDSCARPAFESTRSTSLSPSWSI